MWACTCLRHSEQTAVIAGREEVRVRWQVAAPRRLGRSDSLAAPLPLNVTHPTPLSVAEQLKPYTTIVDSELSENQGTM